ncbi:hypothetical protein F5141DRAFT_996607 [Pisolithus sp. B1]|nr:hypothetical protein F5141DRAFT_996607 [Pisolithus sp. B1]
MFTRLSRQGTQWLTVHVERALSSHEGGDGISVDVSLASLVSPSDLSWSRVAGLCERSILPMYKSLRDIVEGDIEHVSRLLSELDPLGEHGPSEQDATDVGASAFPNSCSGSPPPEGLRRHRLRPSLHHELPIVRPFDPSAPIVIVTPCPDEPRETSCWVPCQDASFGMRLTVPTHVALNRAYPPLLTDCTHPIQRIDEWQYNNGHWYAVVPPPAEQCRRGLYSRPASGRVRSRSRCPRSWMVDVEDSVRGS